MVCFHPRFAPGSDPKKNQKSFLHPIITEFIPFFDDYLQCYTNKPEYSIVTILILHYEKVICLLTVLDSNFLEAILTLALQQNNGVSNQIELH